MAASPVRGRSCPQRWHVTLTVSALALITLQSWAGPDAAPHPSAAQSATTEAPALVSAGSARLGAEQLRRWMAAEGSTAGPRSVTSAQGRLAYVKERIVPALLLQAHAESAGLTKSPAYHDRTQQLLFEALAADEQRRLPPPSAAQIQAYYDAHRADFSRPERLRLWRILVPSEAKALEVLRQARGAGGPERWRGLARESSLDEATSLRGGDLGFVHPDGTTDVPQVRVEPELYSAAHAVADGELVPEPVREGARFAVLWRRGSLDATEVPLATARPTIVALLEEQALAARLDELVTKLRAAHVRDEHPELLDLKTEY